MKNSEMPAMPVTGYQVNASGSLCGEIIHSKGLTKREMFAMHLASAYLNGQLSWTNGVDGGATPSFEEVAEESVQFADALLAELDKE